MAEAWTRPEVPKQATAEVRQKLEKEAEDRQNAYKFKKDGGEIDCQNTLKRNKEAREAVFAKSQAAAAEEAAQAPLTPKTLKEKAAEMVAAANTMYANKYTPGESKMPETQLLGKFSKASLLPKDSDNGSIVIVGTTGDIGAAVTKWLLDNSKRSTVKVVTADPASGKSQAIVRGCENATLVKGSLDAGGEEGLAELLQGARVVLINPPLKEDRNDRTLRAISAAKSAKVKFLVLLSSDSVGTPNAGWHGESLAPLEAAAKNSGIPCCVIRMGWLMQNIFLHYKAIAGQNVYATPMKPDTMFTPIIIEDVAAGIGKVLDKPASHVHKVYTFNGEPVAAKTIAFSMANGAKKEVRYEQISVAECQAFFESTGMPAWQAAAYAQQYDSYNGTKAATVADFKNLTNSRQQLISAWTSANGKSFVALPGPLTFTYAQLTAPELPAACDTSKKESYLCDTEFLSVFGVSKAEFAAMPSWQTLDMRRKQNLY